MTRCICSLHNVWRYGPLGRTQIQYPLAISSSSWKGSHRLSPLKAWQLETLRTSSCTIGSAFDGMLSPVPGTREHCFSCSM